MKQIVGFILLVILSYFSVSAFFQSGFFSIHDDTQIARTSEMIRSLTDGMFPVRWVENLGYGYGYPIFNFYAPLPYYVGGFIGIIGFDALLATKTAFVLATVLAGVFMYVFVNQFFGKDAALVAGIVYLYFPYHAVNIYIRGNLNEVFAYAFLPLILLGFYKIYYFTNEKKSLPLIYILLLGASIAGVITSHNLSAYMVALVLTLITTIALVFSQHKVKFIVYLTVASMVGLGLSGFYWLPVLLEMKYSDVLSQVGGGADYRDHFVCITQYWNSPWGFGGSGPGCVDGMSFKLGKLNIIITILSIIMYGIMVKTRNRKGHEFIYGSVVAILIFSIFISTEFSQFLWNVIPRIDFLQFPWRFINFTAIAMSVLSGLLIVSIRAFVGRAVALFIAAGIIIATIFLNAKLFVPQTFFDRTVTYYTDSDFVRWDTSKISDEYMPPNFSVPQSRSDIPQRKVLISSGNAEVQSITSKTGKLSAVVQAETQSEILLTIAPFPSWKIFMNGNEAEHINTNDGIRIQIPEGKSEITAKFVETPVEKIGNGITLFTIIGIVGWLAREKKYGKKQKK